MKRDAIAYGADRSLLIRLRQDNPLRLPPYPLWHKHKARNLLKKDIDNGKHKNRKPIELYNDRDEYKEFPLSIFRKHIYQDLDSQAKKEYRYAKKKTRARGPMPQESTEEEAKLTEDHREWNRYHANTFCLFYSAFHYI